MSLLSSSSGYLGIDIGKSGIKIVELKREGGRAKLLTYGFSENIDNADNDWENDIRYTAQVINDICDKAGVVSKNAISALPTFSVFSSILNLSNITKKDMPSAVHWEAKKVIPLPLEEMILDWKKIEEIDDGQEKNKKNNVKVLLTGAPRSLVKKYIEIFKQAQINLLSLETETFSLVRALIGNDKSTIMLVEIGATTTDVSIVDRGIPTLSRSIDFGGNHISNVISKYLNIDKKRAEQLKYDLGVSALDSQNNEILEVIEESISPMVNEIKYAINLYQSSNNRSTEKIILSGGSSLLPDLVNYLNKVLNIKVIIGDPWSRVSYPINLKPLLHEIGPRMSVAVGLAMREID